MAQLDLFIAPLTEVEGLLAVSSLIQPLSSPCTLAAPPPTTQNVILLPHTQHIPNTSPSPWVTVSSPLLSLYPSFCCPHSIPLSLPPSASLLLLHHIYFFIQPLFLSSFHALPLSPSFTLLGFIPVLYSFLPDSWTKHSKETTIAVKLDHILTFTHLFSERKKERKKESFPKFLGSLATNDEAGCPDNSLFLKRPDGGCYGYIMCYHHVSTVSTKYGMPWSLTKGWPTRAHYFIQLNTS